MVRKCSLVCLNLSIVNLPARDLEMSIDILPWKFNGNIWFSNWQIISRASMLEKEREGQNE